MTDATAAAAWWRQAQRGRRRALVLLALVLVVSLALSLAVGAADTGLGALFGLSDGGGRLAILTQIRLPRALTAAMVGAALGLSGAAVQGLFRNPLADPGLIGVSAGASLAAVATIVLGGGVVAVLPDALAPLVLPLAAFGGAALATVVVYRIAAGRADLGIAALLLAGIAVNAVAMAGVGVFVFLSNDAQLRTLNFWMLGSVAGATWTVIVPAFALMLPALVLLPRQARALDQFALGERQAWLAGVDVARLKRRTVVLVALAVGAAVAVSGTIGFIGLVVPHLVRLMLGPGHRGVMAGSALLGAALLGGADIVARIAVMPAELPIGLVTALAGGPFFVWLLRRRRGGAA